jgi:hypothetical protein
MKGVLVEGEVMREIEIRAGIKPRGAAMLTPSPPFAGDVPVETTPSHCENCATPLQGEFCHQCGQSVHNPLRDARHAFEEFFESFWHLDGRVFRTLRDLLIPPGLVANRYLAGHRINYVAPLRMFVVMSLLAVVVTQVVSQFSSFEPIGGGTSNNSINSATTIAEVEQQRDRTLQDLRKASDDMTGPAAVGRAGIDEGIATVNQAADARIAALRDAQAKGLPPPAPTTTNHLKIDKTNDWDPQKNPVNILWLPGYANHWLTAQTDRAVHNVPRIRQDPGLLWHAFLGAIPKALFVLVPLFAVLLKLAYIRSGRLYLEHLVVALYSHSWLLLILLVYSLLGLLSEWLSPHIAWVATGIGWVHALLLCSMPVYLLVMQKRVYAQGWIKTLLKYFVLGGFYASMVLVAALVLLVYSVIYA